MPKKTREDFKPYLRCLADKMGLRDWTVYIEEDPPHNPNHSAECDCVYGMKRANVSLSSYFLRSSEQIQRKTIVHELVHAHFAAMHHYLHHVLSEDELVAYTVNMEYGVDAMAEVIAPSMPLPSDVEPGSDADARDEADAGPKV